jgi:hypothetical protein
MNERIPVPRDLRPRIAEVARRHGFESPKAVVDHFLRVGLEAYGLRDGDVGERLRRAADERGYSSVAEVIEHLLLRGLRAYEAPEDDRALLEARLRGLGYLE